MKINDKISPCYGSDCEKCLKEDNNITFKKLPVKAKIRFWGDKSYTAGEIKHNNNGEIVFTNGKESEVLCNIFENVIDIKIDEEV